IKRFACMGEVRYVGHAQLQQDIRNLRTALAAAPSTEAFLTAASPGVIALFQPNQFYPNNAAYIEALADAMREEYEAIHAAGFIVQLDCPDLTGLTSGQVPADLTLRIEAL